VKTDLFTAIGQLHFSDSETGKPVLSLAGEKEPSAVYGQFTLYGLPDQRLVRAHGGHQTGEAGLSVQALTFTKQFGRECLKRGGHKSIHAGILTGIAQRENASTFQRVGLL
jgi:hypothetical protein